MTLKEPIARPDEWDADVVLADGGTVRVRPIRPDDADRLVQLHSRLSPGTIYFRFFNYHPQLSEREVARFTQVDYVDRMALVAVNGPGDLVAVARYDRMPGSDEAEAAFLVEDSFQGRGLGSLLLEHLAAYGRWRGLRRFVADTMIENHPMRETFRHSGFVETTSFQEGLMHITLDLQPAPAAIEAAQERDRRAVVHSLERLLRPRSVAVVGAGRRAGTIGHELLRTMLRDDYAGRVYPVNPTASEILGLPCYPDLASCPDDVDLAVIAVPAENVLDVVADCGHKGVKGLVIISAGFAETGAAGAAAQRVVVSLARGWGMRLIGPNCMGVINTAPDTSLNATFARTPPIPGSVGFCSQSGGLGISILEECSARGLGLSTFVSMGNKADVSGNDVLQYWEDDPLTRVGLMYLESIGNARAFRRIAERFSRSKPLIAIKAGRTTAGSRAASSHTAAMASPDAAVDALFRSAGVIRVDRLEEMFDAAAYLSTQPLPRGPRIAIVGNSGGPGTLAADACVGEGLEVQTLAESTQNALRSFLARGAAVANPVDMVASAGPADYERAISVLADDPEVDAIMVIFTPPIVTSAEDVARAVSAAAARTDKPVVANFLSTSGLTEALSSGPRTVPQFSYPESAAGALARALSYSRWLQRRPGILPNLSDIHLGAARTLLTAVLDTTPEGRWLDAGEANRLVSYFGVPTTFPRRVDGIEQALTAAADIGWPVALKAASPAILHKIDEGAVSLGIQDQDGLVQAWTAMVNRLGDRMGGGLVQPMVAAGVETIVGSMQDPNFGPLVLFGAGGTLVELLEDRRLASAPLTDVDAAELIAASRISRLLTGHRGQPPGDITALTDVVLRIGRLAADLPEVAELDLNPLVVHRKGVMALDVKVRVAPAVSQPELSVRRLR